MSDEIIIPGAGTVNTNPVLARFQLRQGEIQDWQSAGALDTLPGEPLLGYDNNGEVVLKIGDGTEKKWDKLKGFGTADLAEIHKYIEEHGGSWDAISLQSSEDNKQFSFKVNTTTINHSTPTPDGLATAAGMIYNAGPNGSASFGNNDNMNVQGKSTFAVGRNITVNANYASALGAHHRNEGYGAFTVGLGNIITTLANNDGKTKNSQYATAVGQNVGTIGAASFSAGTGNSEILAFVQTLTASNSKEEVYNKWSTLDRGKRPSISWGDWSARFGSYNISIGDNSFVAGGYNAAVGDYSAAFGENNIAKGDWSFVCGINNNVLLKYGFACGGENTILGYYAFVSGMNNTTSSYSAAFGQNNIVKGTHCFASGYSNAISGTEVSHSGVIGMSNYIGTGGYYSLAVGHKNLAHHPGASILGTGLISSTASGLTVGTLNKEVYNGLFVVGNGAGDVNNCSIDKESNKINYNGAEPSNAFVVYSDGHAEVGAASTNDLAVATYGQIKDLKSFITIVDNEGWVETRVDDVLIQVTKKFTIPANTKIYQLEGGYSGLYSLAQAIKSEYAQNLTNIIVQGHYIGSSGSLFVLSSLLANDIDNIIIFFKPLHGMSITEDSYGTYIQLIDPMDISILLTK